MTGYSSPTLRPAPEPGVPGCVIANARPGQSVLVALHGTGLDASEIAARFAAAPAFAQTTIIAPLLAAAEFGPSRPIEVRINALLDDLAAQESLPTARIALFGFSGGAQMAQRFAMRHPQRVARLCLVSAGWYAMPDPAIAWPFGIGDGTGEALVGPDFFDIPTTVIVGNRDTRIDPDVPQDAAILEHQGRNRLRRARCYARAAIAYAERLGSPARPQVLALHGVSGDFAQSVAEGDLLALAAQALLDRAVSSTCSAGAIHKMGYYAGS